MLVFLLICSSTNFFLLKAILLVDNRLILIMAIHMLFQIDFKDINYNLYLLLFSCLMCDNSTQSFFKRTVLKLLPSHRGYSNYILIIYVQKNKKMSYAFFRNIWFWREKFTRIITRQHNFTNILNNKKDAKQLYEIT